MVNQMRKIWCKIWRLINDALKDSADTIAYALDTVGTVAVDVLGDFIEDVSNGVGSIFGGKGSLLFVLGGLGLVFLLTRGSKEKRQSDDLRGYTDPSQSAPALSFQNGGISL